MNCRPGDLAIVTRVEKPSFRWCLGRVVRVVRVTHVHPHVDDPLWVIEHPLTGPHDLLYGFVPDRCLTPIQPLPEDDGVLTRRPEEITP